MRFELTIEMDNAAFDDAGEVPRILKSSQAKYARLPTAATGQ